MVERPLSTILMPVKKFEALTDRKIATLSDGRHSDGNNLYLFVRGGSRVWVFRYKIGDKRREMQLGIYPILTLREARHDALHWCRVLREGRDPLEVREAERSAAQLEKKREKQTLEQRCRDYHDTHKHLWRNPKHANQWLSSLETHIFPVLGHLPLYKVTAAQLLDVLKPLNLTHHETAKRIRQRLEAVWSEAILEDITKDNPPASLIRQLKGPAVKSHFRSLDYRVVPEFVQQLRDSDAGAAVRLGFEFLILACARTTEIRHAQWAEINRGDRVWRIPAARMKAGEPHDVPLTDRMLRILDAAAPLTGGKGHVFPGQSGKALSDGAFLATLRRMDRHHDTTVHGFRASFDTWASETTPFRTDIIEAALAHEEQNAVRAAYNRAEYWRQRVELADQWTKFLTTGEDGPAFAELAKPPRERGRDLVSQAYG
ncbi:MAG: integrase arm-type DNA-binding domain-containing protein [Nevskia sp.]|nr:integrase arm-type DNA-binding domain-containing protein [Nevskia sp.]